MLFVSKKAAEMVLMSAQASDSETMGLRISVLTDDKNQLVYNMGFDEQRDEDTLWESNGVKVLVAGNDVEQLKDTVMDFQDVPKGGPQFTFLTGKNDEFPGE